MSYNRLLRPFEPSGVISVGNEIRSAYPSTYCSTDLAILTLYFREPTEGFNNRPAVEALVNNGVILATDWKTVPKGTSCVETGF